MVPSHSILGFYTLLDFIRQEAGSKGCIPPLAYIIADPNSDLEAREYAIKAIVNLALNCMHAQGGYSF